MVAPVVNKMEINFKIKNLIKEALKNLGLGEVDFVVEHPADLKMGDYSTNVAMVLAKAQKTNPKELAEKILQEMSKSLFDTDSDIERVVSAGNGFINFYLSKEFLQNSVIAIVDTKNHNENFGHNEIFAGKKVMVEYTDPNPFKPFHIGHLMTNVIGESVSRFIAFSGGEVLHANYQGDVGLHVAKAIYGLLKKGKPENDLSIKEQAEYIGKCYSFGSGEYEENEGAKKEIDAINKKVYEKNDERINELYDWGRRITLEAFEKIYEMLGTKFEYYFFESEMAPIGMKMVKENIGKVFEESDGAIVFKAEKHDPKLHTRVFINSQGLPTYETKDIGLNITKFEKENLDLSVIVTASEQADYMRVVQKALSFIKPEVENKMRHITHGMLRFASGKMSSRKGNVVTGESLINDVRHMVYEKIRDRGFSEDEKEKIATDVGVSALKFSVLKQASGGDIVYDFDKSISFEGDSGPYLQYAYTRAKAVFKKAQAGNFEAKLQNFLPAEFPITEVEKLLYRFPEVVERSAKEFEPHYMTNYLIEIARAFNSFYGNNKIIDEKDANSPYKVAICEAFSVVMKNGLHLLGISTPEKM